jgi:endo-1,3(4)-beta-glucanase
MKSSIVRGMPYLTMRYESTKFQAQDGGGLILPTLWSDMTLQSATVDEAEILECSSGMVPAPVNREIMLTFQIEMTWLVFFSRPVQVKCSQDGPFLLQVADQDDDAPLIIRLALVINKETDVGVSIEANSAEYESILRKHAHVYPGDNTGISYEINDAKAEATVTLNWDAQTVTPSADNEPQLVMFGMPHHLDKIDGLPKFCKISLFGQTCLVEGNSWAMKEELPQASFRAPRHPAPEFLPALTEALQTDIRFTIPENFLIGAGDTYFSGKKLGKLARIILIADEVMELCAYVRQSDSLGGQDIDGYSRAEYVEACNNSYLPTDDDVNKALLELQRGIEIWISEEAQAPFVYDAAWGGLVNCGCDYLDGVCLNTLPDCPAFTDRGLNFGNGTFHEVLLCCFRSLVTLTPQHSSTGFYNDHHFHYGYFIYAAAVATHFDQAWGRQHFDKLFLLVRDIANPSVDDTAFPRFRQKDWFQGSSWANGIGSPPSLNGRDQESSSEAVAAYDAVALFGSAMVSPSWQIYGEQLLRIASK